MDPKLKKKLAAAKENWKKAKTRAGEATGGFTEIEDGRYLARLTNAEITESRTSGRLQIAWTYAIQEGDYKGEKKMDFDGLETEDNLVYLAKKLATYGYQPPDDLDEVEQIVKSLLEARPLVRIRLKTRGEFQNVYIDKVFDKDDEDDALDTAEARVKEEPAEEEPEEREEPAAEEEEEEEEEAPAEEEEEGVELQIGMKVIAKTSKGERKGVVLEILEKEEKVRVKTADNKVVKVSLDAIEFDEDDSDVPEEPKKK